MRATEPAPVLVIGDDARYRTSVAQVLRLAGHEVVITADQASAVSTLRGGVDPALCLIDGPVDPRLAAELVARSAQGRDDAILLLQPSEGLAERPPFATSMTLFKPVTERELLAAVAAMRSRPSPSPAPPAAAANGQQ